MPEREVATPGKPTSSKLILYGFVRHSLCSVSVLARELGRLKQAFCYITSLFVACSSFMHHAQCTMQQAKKSRVGSVLEISINEPFRVCLCSTRVLSSQFHVE